MKTTILSLLCSVLYLGNSVAQSSLPLRYEIQGTQLFASIGETLGRIPDLNGDGVDELIVSATTLGQIAIHSGVDGSPLLTLVTSGLFDDFGSAVCGLPDISGDGIPDLAVGAPGDDTVDINSGRVDYFSGNDGALLFSTYGDFLDDSYGASIAAIQDLDGDNVADVIVGAPGTFSNGFVRVISGASGSTINTFFGPVAGSAMGFRVVAINDIDGDGLQEIGCSAVLAANANGALEAGRVFVISGNAQTLLSDTGGLAAGDHYGVALAALDDVDGDGAGDFVVGAVNDQRGGPDAGSAFIVSGNGQILADIIGQQPFALFGGSVADLGDVDGDGKHDVGIGAILHDGSNADTGLVSVRCGATGNLIEDLDGLEPTAQFGSAIMGLGDVNNDGFSEFAVAMPNSSANQFLGGIIRIISIGGVRPYRSSNLPAVNRSLIWEAGPVTDRANGRFVVEGASPFDLGIVGVSFAPGELDFGGLPILLNIDPSLLVVNDTFFFGFEGTALFPTSIRVPFLKGLLLFIQVYDAQFPYGATNGLEVRFL